MGTRTTVCGLQGLLELKGQLIGTSDWMAIDQDRIGQFASATGDHQWIHLDVERAKRDSPFGGPVAHGFLTLSLIPSLLPQILRVEGVRMGVNYGLNRVRFTAPVPAGKRVRMHGTLLDVEPDESAQTARLTWSITLELEGHPKPACVAEVLSLYYF